MLANFCIKVYFFLHSIVDGNWSVPLTANEKNYRATYRSVSKGVYVEDLSYWQCIETSDIHSQIDGSQKNSVKMNISGVIYDTVQKGLECCKGSSYAWLENCEQQTIAMVFFVKLSKNTIQWWCHPSRFESVFSIKVNTNCVFCRLKAYILFVDYLPVPIA